MPQRRNFIDIQSDAKIRLENNTPVSNFTSIGTISNLSDIQSIEDEKIYEEIEYVHSIYDPTKTYGRELDNIGFMFGKSRTGSATATDNSSTNFYFYLDPRTNVSIGTLIQRLFPIATHYNIRKKLLDEGYIDDIEAPTQLLIPAGTVTSNVDSTITYTTVDNIYFTNSSNEIYTPVVANIEGTSHNVQSNVLIKHNLNQIAVLKDLAKYILCTNRYPVTNGYNGDPDDVYRYNLTLGRINYGTNEIAIRQAALGIPGVRNILFERGRFGNGTYNVIVEGVSPIVSEGLLTILKQRLAALGPGGEILYVNRPEYIGVELKIDLITSLTSNLDELRESVRNDIISHINDIPMGGTIIWNKLIGLIMDRGDVDDFILNYYKMGNYDIFNKINKNQVVLRPVNQRSKYNDKFYCDSGLISLCCVQS